MNDSVKKFLDDMTRQLDNSVVSDRLIPVPADGPSVELAWNNYYGSWTDGGWNNYYGSWSDGGWNNYYGSWSDGGWNNYYGSWSDGGWNNYYGSWGNGNTGGGGGCFLTSACVEHKGLPDDCYELTLLRRFRDEYVLSTEKGKCDIAHYYTVAPKIVSKIKLEANAKEIFKDIYSSLITPCVELISLGENAKAYCFYKQYSTELEQKYLEMF